MPTQDDVWFWGMAVLNGTKIKVVSSYDMQLITVENTQEHGLCKINTIGKRGMSAQDGFNNFAKFYPQVLEKLAEE